MARERDELEPTGARPPLLGPTLLDEMEPTGVPPTLLGPTLLDEMEATGARPTHHPRKAQTPCKIRSDIALPFFSADVALFFFSDADVVAAVSAKLRPQKSDCQILDSKPTAAGRRIPATVALMPSWPFEREKNAPSIGLSQ